jgi:hypothetical protein
MASVHFKLILPSGMEDAWRGRVPVLVSLEDLDGTNTTRPRSAGPQTAIPNPAEYTDRVEAVTHSLGDFLSPQQWADMARLPILRILWSSRGAEPEDVIKETIGADAVPPFLSWGENAYAEMLTGHPEDSVDPDELDHYDPRFADHADPGYFIEQIKEAGVWSIGRFLQRRFGMSAVWLEDRATEETVERFAASDELDVTVIPVNRRTGIDRDNVTQVSSVVDRVIATNGELIESWPTAHELLTELEEFCLLHAVLEEAVKIDIADAKRADIQPELEPDPDVRLRLAFGPDFDAVGEERQTTFGIGEIDVDEAAKPRTPGQLAKDIRRGTDSLVDDAVEAEIDPVADLATAIAARVPAADRSASRDGVGLV